ncbi:MATE family efflux transporter [Sulfurospirillum arcachonense]|uniref:MATE family efflux transporter n=1 Tax=Sulfurospirillum arcachonense TaxID=57666 RepID=UPI00046979DE|nr:MATE family efflux transporter [Sulfurospirillum arcachonense]
MSSDLTQGCIKNHLRSIAIPSSIGYFFHTMFNVTDTYFAGDISTQAVASLSLTSSIFFIVIAIAGGMSQGLTALLGNAIGQKDIVHAKQIIFHAGILALFLSIILTIIGLISAPHLIVLLKADGQYLEEALAYVNIILLGAIFYVGVFFSNAILNSIGNTIVFRNFLISGFLLNILFDFWFVKGGLGIAPLSVKGIAYATIIVECFGMAYLLYNVKKTYLLKDLPKFKFDIDIIVSFFKQGFPPTMNMSLMAFGTFILTYFIASFGQHAIAGYGIAIRIEQIVLLPSIGINVAVLAIVSQNNGAGLFDRIRQTMQYAQKVGLMLWIIGMFFIFAFGEFMISFFSKDPLVIDAAMSYLIAAGISLYGYVLVFINVSLLQGIKKPSLIIYLSLFRQLIIPTILFSIFSFYKLALGYYWFGLALTVWSSALFILWYAKRKLQELDPI